VNKMQQQIEYLYERAFLAPANRKLHGKIRACTRQ
jgi:hypothetical protein